MNQREELFTKRDFPYIAFRKTLLLITALGFALGFPSLFDLLFPPSAHPQSCEAPRSGMLAASSVKYTCCSYSSSLQVFIEKRLLSAASTEHLIPRIAASPPLANPHSFRFFPTEAKYHQMSLCLFGPYIHLALKCQLWGRGNWFHFINWNGFYEWVTSRVSCRRGGDRPGSLSW